MLRIMRTQKLPLERFHEKFAIQLNDTHPAIAVAELMRLLVDEHAMPWDDGLGRSRAGPSPTPTTRCCPRRWSAGRSPVRPRAAAAPRDHLRDQRALPRRGAAALPRRRGARRAAVADRRERRALRAHGAPRLRRQPRDQRRRALHSELLKRDVLRDFHELWPEKFKNKTNGVTPRRWVVLGNPRLASLISDAIGDALDHGPGRAAHGSSRWPTTRRSAPRGATIKHDNKGALAPTCAGAPASRSIRPRCSTCRSSASTSTSAST